MNIAQEEKNALLFMQVLCLITGIAPILAFPFSVLSVGIPKTVLWISGLYAFTVLLLPVFFLKKFDIFEPICFTMLMVLLGTTLRSFYVAFFENDTISFDLLLGKPPGALIGAGIMIIASLAAFVCGYMVRSPRMDLSGIFIFRRQKWNTPLLILMVLLLCAVGIIGTVLYLKEMGVTSFVLSNISTKRFLTVAGSQYKSSLAYYQWLALASQPAFFLFFTWFAASDRKFFSLYLLPIILLLVLAMAFPILNSSKSGALEVVMVALVIWHYVRKRITIKFLAKVFVVAMVVIVIMSVLRKKPETVSSVQNVSGHRIVDMLIANRQYLAIDKLQHIADAMPERLDYQYGNTFLSFLYAPIPRTSWPEKPPIMLGQEVAAKVYDFAGTQGGGGVPPGFVPELYMNFHMVGVVIGMFILGLVLKFMYLSFHPLLDANKNVVLIYVPLLTGFSMHIIANSFSAAVITTLMSLIPIFFSLLVISSSKPVRS